MSKYQTEYLNEAYKHSRFNKQEIRESESCACFHCGKSFPAAEITGWGVEDNFMVNAICPYCNTVSVIGSKSGLPIDDEEFLSEMRAAFFSGEKEKDINLFNEFNKFRSQDRGF